MNFEADDDDCTLGSQLLRMPVAQAPVPRAALAPRFKAREAVARQARATSSAEEGEEEAEEEEGCEEEGEGEEEEDGGEGGASAAPAAAAGKKRSRHAPAELPSNRGVGRFRQVLAVPTRVTRDPRYEASAGTLKEELFQKSYAFLEDKRAEEMQVLQKQLKRSKDPERVQELKGDIARRKQATAEAKRVTALREAQRSLKRSAQEAVAGGSKAYFPKQRELKELEAVERFKALEAAGGASAVEKALKKRRVTLSKKDRTKLPPRGGAR